MKQKMRLIDADTLKAEFTGNFHETWHYTGVRATIDNAPTIDAVPVVRCKECKYSYEKDFGYGKTLFCSLDDYARNAEDFCSDGERREDTGRKPQQ